MAYVLKVIVFYYFLNLIPKRLEYERASKANLQRELCELKKDIILRSVGDVPHLEVLIYWPPAL